MARDGGPTPAPGWCDRGGARASRQASRPQLWPQAIGAASGRFRGGRDARAPQGGLRQTHASSGRLLAIQQRVSLTECKRDAHSVAVATQSQNRRLSNKR